MRAPCFWWGRHSCLPRSRECGSVLTPAERIRRKRGRTGQECPGCKVGRQECLPHRLTAKSQHLRYGPTPPRFRNQPFTPQNASNKPIHFRPLLQIDQMFSPGDHAIRAHVRKRNDFILLPMNRMHRNIGRQSATLPIQNRPAAPSDLFGGMLAQHAGHQASMLGRETLEHLECQRSQKQ